MKTFTTDAGATLSYDDRGEGPCVVALHGAYSTHEEIAAFLDPVLGPPRSMYRRLYPDLPGMGTSSPHPSIRTSNDVIDVLEQLIDTAVGPTPLRLIGHSFGAHLARGLAARRPQQVVGLALLCPMLPGAMNPEPHVVLQAEGDPAAGLDPDHVDDYLGYFVIHTPDTATRFNEAVAPSLGRFDADAVERVMGAWNLDPDPDLVAFDAPTLILAGRHDSVVGFREQIGLIDRYPKSSYAVISDAGHALPHERRDLATAMIDDWLAST